MLRKKIEERKIISILFQLNVGAMREEKESFLY
jgi:hypothetical protein